MYLYSLATSSTLPKIEESEICAFVLPGSMPMKAAAHKASKVFGLLA